MIKRLLAVHAHPDDESSKGAATYARYVSEGAQVLVVSCTGGERGEVQNEELEQAAMAGRDIAGLRRLEMASAQAVIGIEHRWLGYEDSGLPEPGEILPPNCFALVPLEHAVVPLVKVIREFRPHVLVTYDETGGYPHPDHIRTHELSMYAWRAAADSSRFTELGQPWTIAKVYYDRIFNVDRLTRMHAALMAIDSPRADGLAGMLEWLGDTPSPATTHVEVGGFLEIRDAALRCHSSQVAPDDAFFFWPNDVQRTAWPFEDFQLVESTVDSNLPESDLFSGITPDVEDTP